MKLKQINLEQVRKWQKNPVTRAFFGTLTERLNILKDTLFEYEGVTETNKDELNSLFKERIFIEMLFDWMVNELDEDGTSPSGRLVEYYNSEVADEE